MNNDLVNDAFHRGFTARLQILSAAQEKQAMAAAMKGMGTAAMGVGKNVWSKVAPAFRAPGAKPVPPAGAPWGSVGPSGAPANPSLLAQGMGAVARNPVKSLAAAGALGAAGAGAGTANVAKNYYGTQAQNAITELPNVVKDYMTSQGAGPGMGGMMGKIMMFLQYLFGGQHANRNLGGNIAQFAAQSNRLTPLNRSQFAQGAQKLQAPLPAPVAPATPVK